MEIAEVNNKVLTNIFKNFNKDYFNNELPLPHFEITNMKSYLGRFEFDKCYSISKESCIKISTFYKYNEHELEAVMIHEMVHSWQWVHNRFDGHRDAFKRKASEINFKTHYKYKISRLTELSDETILRSRPQTKHINDIVNVMVYYTNSGRKVAVLSNKQVDNIRRWFFRQYKQYKPEIHKCRYVSMFDDFSKSVKNVHGYDITDDEFNTILKPNFI